MPTNKVQTGLRLNEVTYEKAKILAMKEQRSLNNFIEHVVQLYIDDYEHQNGPLQFDTED